MTDSKGRFGAHGGQYISETLMNAVDELEKAYNYYKEDEGFKRELDDLLKKYAGRPSLLYYAKNMTKDLGGAKVYLKREDLNHTGAHKINNVLGQCLLAKKMGKKRVIAETGAGQHGVATATVAALMGMECEIFMGEVDCKRQALNVYRMKLLGAKVHSVSTGTGTLKDAVSETMSEWTRRIDDTHYVLGSAMGPHPFPTIVRDFQAVISKEAREQILAEEGRLPDAVIACVGGGSNAIGSFYNFINDKNVELIGCEAAGKGADTFETAATIATGRLGIFHGMKSYFCQDKYGQIAPVYSISAGLDYPGVGPEHAFLHDEKRAKYVPITDDEAVDAFENGKAFIPFITSGDPSLETTEQLVYAMDDAGADIIELGVPFSDPTAEGPVIQAANLRALSAGTTTDKIFSMIAKIRQKTQIPLILMTYANVVYSYDTELFLKKAASVGVDGLILADVPYEEKEEFSDVCDEYGLCLISMVAPTSKERIKMIAKDAKGFVYCVSSLGVTGTRKEIKTDVSSMVKLVKEANDIPCAIGFGISMPETAHEMALQSDGTIVGSAIVKICEKYGAESVPYVAEYVKQMKEAVSKL